jgi:hypothetical protein
MKQNPALLLMAVALGAFGVYTLFFATAPAEQQPPTKWRIMRDPAPRAVQARAMYWLGQAWAQGAEHVEMVGGQWVRFVDEWHPPDPPVGPNVWHHGVTAYEPA